MIFKKIENIGILSTKNDFERDQIKIINFFLSIIIMKLFIELIIHVLINQKAGFFITLITILVSLFSFFKPAAIRLKKTYITLYYCWNNFLIFFFSSYITNHATVSLYYFIAILTIPFLFNIKKEKKNIAIILSTIFVGLLINIITKFKLFNSAPHIKVPEIYTWLIIFQSSTLFLIILWYVLSYDYFLRALYKRQQNNEIYKESNSTNINQNLFQLIKSKDPIFYSEFTTHYDLFIIQLLKLNPELITTELEICAMCKLNLSTKEIAIATNSTIKSVESKKYRIRKKLNIPSNIELSIWLNHNIYT